MHKLLYDRVRLIRGLQLALNNGFSDQEKHAIANIVTTIRTESRTPDIGVLKMAGLTKENRESYAKSSESLSNYI